MIPESSFSKIVCSNLEVVFKVSVEGVFIFGAAGLIMRESPLNIAVAVVVYALFGLLLLGVNYISLRWTGADMSTGVMLLLYTFAVLIIMAPGVVGAIAAAVLLFPPLWGQTAALGILAVWELLAAVVCFAVSKGILHSCDMPVIKPRD
jgi:hypothetical protein